MGARQKIRDLERLKSDLQSEDNEGQGIANKFSYMADVYSDFAPKDSTEVVERLHMISEQPGDYMIEKAILCVSKEIACAELEKDEEDMIDFDE